MNIKNFVSTDATIVGSFFIGVLIGYALKKVVKLVAGVVGTIFRWHSISTIRSS